MKVTLAALAVLVCLPAFIKADSDLSSVSGLSCPKAGYMHPDADNLCFVWYCVRPGEAPIKRPCPKGVRVPSWWEGGELNMCNVVNIVKHGGDPVCLRCDANDVPPKDHCADLESPCPDGCTCIDQEHTHRCDCPVTNGVNGGVSVDPPVNHCEPNMCENGATCQNQWDGYFCFCPSGWTGHRCETSVCDWHPCLNGGTCVVDEVGYHCDCPDCWTGSCCNVTVPSCKQLACGPCHTGPNCETPINNCGCANPCGDNGVCVDGDSGPSCQDCGDCFTGPLCKVRKDNCKCNNNCPTNSRCEDLIDVKSHECVCDKCWEGAKCDVPVVSCECNNPCEGAPCTMMYGKPVCGCKDKCYTGALCDQKIDTCECNPCPNGETCSMDGSGTRSCGCADSCKYGPGCANTVNSCECANPCTDKQTCSLVDGELTCSCSDPCMTGANCDTRINSCKCNNPCLNDGVCNDGPTGPQCSACASCWGGAYCGDKVVDCDCNSPCGASEVCNMVDDAPVCGCPDCYTGPNCDIPVDSCACNNPCTKKDTCKDVDGKAVCECDCVGNEECREDQATGNKVCKCPDCYYNKDGEKGCQTPVTNLCVCNNPCTADQQVCVDSAVGKEPICKIGNPSSGNAFTVVFEENHTEKSIRQIPLELYLTPAVPNSGPRRVNIRSAGLKQDSHCYFNVNKTIPENDVLRFEVERCMMHNKTGLDKVSIRLTELNNDTMLVYGINKDRWSADGFLATPDVQTGKVFQTASYSPAHRATQFAIAALFDDTDIEIILADDNDLPAPYNVKGAVYKFSMNAFETFQVQATCPLKRNDKKSSCNKDLTGTVIKSSKNIHVVSGNIRAFVEAGKGLSRDHLVEELVSTDRWGTYFGLMTIPRRAVGDLLNIMALHGETTQVSLYINDQAAETIILPQNGRVNVYQEVPSNSRIVIKSDKPLSVTQLTKSKDTYQYRNETVHDPVSITVPPVAQFTNNFFFSTPYFTGGEKYNLQPYNTTYALMVAKSGDEGDITVDGEVITKFVTPWTPLPVIEGEDALVGAVISLPHGTRIIRNTQGKNFQCLIYGFDDRESYGLPAAMNFAAINN